MCTCAHTPGILLPLQLALAVDDACELLLRNLALGMALAYALGVDSKAAVLPLRHAAIALQPAGELVLRLWLGAADTSLVFGADILSGNLQSWRVIGPTADEAGSGEEGGGTHQYEMPFSSSHRSENAQISAAATHTPRLCRISPIT